MDSSQRFQAPLPLPHSQFQFGPSGSFVNQAQFLGSSGSFGGNQAPFFLPRSEPQYYPSGNFSGHQAPFRPTGPGGVFQSAFPGFSGIPGDGMQLKTIKAIESDGQHYVIPATDYACGVGNTANDFKLALAPPSGGSSKVFIYFYSHSTLTVRDVEYHFRKYGPVNYVQIPTGRAYGFVSFMYPETVKLILPENRQRTHHICGKPVEVYPYKEKHELEKPAQRDAHSKSGAHIVSDINVTLRNTAESSNVSNHMDEISASQDSPGKEKGPDTEEELEALVKQIKFIKGDFKANKIHVYGPNPLSHLLAARTQPQVYELPTPSACQCTEQPKFEAAIKSVQTKLNQETKGRVLEKLHRERIHIENVSKMLLSLEAEADQGTGGRGSVEDDGLRPS